MDPLVNMAEVTAAGGDNLVIEEGPVGLLADRLTNVLIDNSPTGISNPHPPSEASLLDGEPGPATLESLPLELLMHVCSYVDAKFISSTLSCVSQPFHDILNVDSYWKSRILNRWPYTYPAVSVDDFDWRKACIEREEMSKKWACPRDYHHVLSYHDNIFAPVDCVHILKDKNIFVSGSRDRYLNMVDINKLTENPASMKAANIHSSLAHKGWIWSVASLDNQLCTGSWDTYIKLWDLNAGCTEINHFKCRSAILNVHLEKGCIIAGSYDKRIYQIDPREGIVSDKRYHRQPILCLAVNKNYIITGSEDKTICITDRTAGKTFKTIPLEYYPMCMSYGDNQLWVGDKQGQLHLFDPTNGLFDLVDSYDVGHSGKVTSIQHTTGAIFTSSTDNTVKVLHPTQNPAEIFTIAESGEQATVHYRNGILAYAGSGNSVHIWKPKDMNIQQDGANQNLFDQDQSETIPDNINQSDST